MVSLWGSVENLNLSDHLINKFSKVEIYIYNKVHPASTQEQGCWIPKLSYERKTFLQFVLIMITLSVIDLTITLTMNNIFWGKCNSKIIQYFFPQMKAHVYCCICHNLNPLPHPPSPGHQPLKINVHSRLIIKGEKLNIT